MNPPTVHIVIRFSSLGDIALALPVVFQLQNSVQQGDRILWLTKERYRRLIETSLPGIEVITLPSSKIKDLFHMIQRIRQQCHGYRIRVYDIHRSLRSLFIRIALLAFPSKNRFRVYTKNRFRRFLYITYKWKRIYHPPPVIVRYAQALGVNPEALSPLPRSLPPHRSIGLVIDAAWANKEIPFELQYGITLALLDGFPAFRIELWGAPSSKEKARRLQSLIPHRNRIVDRTYLTIDQLLPTIQTLALLITPDSGLKHIANIFAIPVLSLEGPLTNRLGFYPYFQPHLCIEKKDLSCRPCTSKGKPYCPRGHHLCMKHSVQEVVRAVENLLGVV